MDELCELACVGHPGTIGINVAWTLFNVVLLGVAIAVARESRQRRHTVRMERAVPSDLLLSDGSVAQGITSDISNGGVQARIEGAIQAAVGDSVRFVFPLLDGTATLPARVIALEGDMLRAKFDSLSMQETEALTMILYSRADTWISPNDERAHTPPLNSLGHILRVSLYGLSQTARSILGGRLSGKHREDAGEGLRSGVILLLLLGALLWMRPGVTWAAQATEDPSAAANIQATADDLSLLPLPFYNSATDMHPVVSFVFLSRPTPEAMRAAGIIASWFGILTNEHGVRFSISLGTIPTGNAVVIADKAEDIPTLLGLSDGADRPWRCAPIPTTQMRSCWW